MDISISKTFDISCPNCSSVNNYRLWFVVDTLERPDLVELIVARRINSFTCSKCHTDQDFPVPVIIYRSNSHPKLTLAIREQGQSSEDDYELVTDVIGQLKDSMKSAWDERWLHHMPIIEQTLLPMLLTRGFGAVQLEHMKRNFAGPMDTSSQLIFEVLENLPSEELETFLVGFTKLNNDDEFSEYLKNYPKIDQLIDSAIRRSIIDSAAQIEPLADKAADLLKVYQKTKNPNMLSQAISCWENVLAHPMFTSLLSDERASILNDAGVAWRTRFDENHNVGDLYQSIKLFETGISLTSEDSFLLSSIFMNLGPALWERFQIHGRKEDLDCAITMLKKARESVGNIKSDNVFLLINLGACLADRFDYFGNLDDLTACIQNYRMAEKVLMPEHEFYPAVLCNLGSSLMRWVETEKGSNSLGEAIYFLEKAETLTSKESPFLGEVLLNLGLGYSHRWERLGNPEDLNDALDKLESAALLMSGTPNKLSLVLSNLSNSYMNRYERFGNPMDLDASIEKATLAESMSSPDNPGLSILLNALGHGLVLRYHLRGNLSDLDIATNVLHRALKFATKKSPLWFLVLGNLGACYHDQFIRKMDLRYLANAVGIEELIVSNSSADSPDHPNRLSNLAGSLLSIHNYIKNLDPQKQKEFAQLRLDVSLPDPLLRAIQLRRDALSFVPEQSPTRDGHLSGLATCLFELFRVDKDSSLSLLEEAINILDDVLFRTTHEVAKAGYYLNLATMIQERWLFNQNDRDLIRARDAYKRACIYGISHSLEICLNSGLNWGNWALERREWQEATEAYQHSINALDELVRAQVLRPGKELWLQDAKDLAAYAAYAYARLGNLDTALLILEKGRVQILSQSLDLVGSDLESLQDVRPDLATSYYLVAQKIWSLRNEEIELKLSADKEMELNQASQELDSVIKSIRGVDGYSEFLQPTSLEKIRLVARCPIIYLSVTSVGTVGIIVHGNLPLQAIWFDNLTAQSLKNQLAGYLDSGLPTGYFYTYDCWQIDPGNSAKKQDWQHDLDELMKWLWDVLMDPIMVTVRQFAIKELIIIPQGQLNFLPLHGSWTDDPVSPNGRQYALDKCTISYAANAKVLIDAQRKVEKISAHRLFAVSDPTGSLSYAPYEVSLIKKLFKKEIIYYLSGEQAERKAVLDALDQYDILHFATHAQTDYGSPLESGLVLANGQILSLRHILKKKLPRARIAVLSACETGFPSLKTPDELISLPMGMMEAGVPGTIASLWPVDDISTMLLMVCFYDLWHSQGLTPRDALRQAQLWLRDASADEINRYIQDVLFDLEKLTSMGNLSDEDFMRRLKMETEDRDFKHPYYWAGFYYMGI